MPRPPAPDLPEARSYTPERIRAMDRDPNVHLNVNRMIGGPPEWAELHEDEVIELAATMFAALGDHPVGDEAALAVVSAAASVFVLTPEG